MRKTRSYGRSRCLLAASHLEAFRKWILKRGWFEEPCHPANPYEVLRLRRHSDFCKPGEPTLSIIYRRSQLERKMLDGTVVLRDRHLTVQKELVPFVREFLDSDIRERSQPKKYCPPLVTGRP